MSASFDAEEIVLVSITSITCDALRKVMVFNFCRAIVDFEPSFRKSSGGQ